MTLVVNHSASMDIQSFNKKLSKISVILESIEDGTNLSSLERDLLLSYIRDLYDLAIDGQSLPKAKPSPIVVEKVAEPVVVTAPKVVEAPKPAPVEVVLPPVAEPVAVKPPVAEPVVEPSPAPPVVEVIPEPAPEPIAAPAPKSNTNIQVQPEAIRELFAEEKIQDISEKLSLTPIKDLTKSMGINERVLILQELFGNNREHFAESLEKLNSMSGFADASSYIIDVLIPKYDWTADKRFKPATQFIKLVRRRYI